MVVFNCTNLHAIKVEQNKGSLHFPLNGVMFDIAIETLLWDQCDIATSPNFYQFKVGSLVKKKKSSLLAYTNKYPSIGKKKKKNCQHAKKKKGGGGGGSAFPIAATQ